MTKQTIRSKYLSMFCNELETKDYEALKVECEIPHEDSMLKRTMKMHAELNLLERRFSEIEIIMKKYPEIGERFRKQGEEEFIGGCIVGLAIGFVIASVIVSGAFIIPII